MKSALLVKPLEVAPDRRAVDSEPAGRLAPRDALLTDSTIFCAGLPNSFSVAHDAGVFSITVRRCMKFRGRC